MHFDYFNLDFNQYFREIDAKMASKLPILNSRNIYHPGKNLLGKIILARVVDHPGKNLLSKIILARVVNFSVKPPRPEREFLTSKLLLKIVRIRDFRQNLFNFVEEMLIKLRLKT